MIDTSAIREDKDRAYGDPKVSLGAIGGVWTAYLRLRWQDLVFEGNDTPEITADMVADMMTVMKVMRRANPDCPSDSLIDCGKDIAVYADIATECDARVDKA